MAQTIQLRRDTATNWTTVNPTLAQGELGYETDTGQFKVGNGTTAWNSLPYGFVMPNRGSVYQWTALNPTDVAGTLTTAGSTGTSVPSSFISQVNSAGTLTITFANAGKYFVNVAMQSTHTQAYTADRTRFNLGGTSTRYISTNVFFTATPQYDQSDDFAFLVAATAGQTITIQPQIEVTGSGLVTAHTYNLFATTEYLGL